MCVQFWNQHVGINAKKVVVVLLLLFLLLLLLLPETC
jgi:hypothetical protein